MKRLAPYFKASKAVNRGKSPEWDISELHLMPDVIMLPKVNRRDTGIYKPKQEMILERACIILFLLKRRVMPRDRHVAIKVPMGNETKMRKLSIIRHWWAFHPQSSPAPGTAETVAPSMTSKPKWVGRDTWSLWHWAADVNHLYSALPAFLKNLHWLYRAWGAMQVECANDKLSLKAYRTQSFDL